MGSAPLLFGLILMARLKAAAAAKASLTALGKCPQSLTRHFFPPSLFVTMSPAQTENKGLRLQWFNNKDSEYSWKTETLTVSQVHYTE